MPRSTSGSESSVDNRRFVEVVPLTYLPRGIQQRYTYDVPPELPTPEVGQLVRVEFRRRRVTAVVTQLLASPHDHTKPVIEALPYPPLNVHQQTLARLLQTEHAASETLAYKVMVPELPRRPSPTLPRLVGGQLSLGLTPHQVLVMPRCQPDHRWLLGAMGQTLEAGGQVLSLAPDRLTAEALVQSYRTHYPKRVRLWHGELTSRVRSELWLALASGAPLCVVGTRSALFLPFLNLAHVSLISADEDGHKCWDQQPYYDVRTLVERLRTEASQPPAVTLTQSLPPFLVGPTLEVAEVALPARSPRLFVINRRQMAIEERRAAIPEAVQRAIEESLSSGESSLVFVNRRGLGTVTCAECGNAATCEDCASAFRLTRSSTGALVLRCARCDRTLAAPTVCAVCRSARLRSTSLTSERVAAECQRLFGAPRVVAIQREVSDGSQAVSQLLERLRGSQPLVVVATALILPRLWTVPHFSTVTLLDLDGLKAVPSYTAEVRALQTIHQLRAAALRKFLVVASSDRPPELAGLTTDGLSGLFALERSSRERYGYPPYRRLVRCTVPETDQRWPKVFAELARDERLTVLPPHREQRFLQFIIKATHHYPLPDLWATLPATWRIDVDPIDL